MVVFHQKPSRMNGWLLCQINGQERHLGPPHLAEANETVKIIAFIFVDFIHTVIFCTVGVGHIHHVSHGSSYHRYVRTLWYIQVTYFHLHTQYI